MIQSTHDVFSRVLYVLIIRKNTVIMFLVSYKVSSSEVQFTFKLQSGLDTRLS